jgi:dihydrofolate reductase
MDLISVAAVAENGVIGDENGDVPWDLPEDVDQYRERVADYPVILGRRTYEMYENPPGSTQIVLSRTERDWDRETAHHAGGVEDAVDLVASLGADRAYVVGGGGIYDLFQPHLTGMALTRVPGEYEGTTYYPDWDEAEWELLDTEAYDGFTVKRWERKRDPR